MFHFRFTVPVISGFNIPFRGYFLLDTGKFKLYSDVKPFFLVALLAIAAPSQETTAVTLDQATRESLDKNLDVIAERLGISVAETRMITAKLRPNPVLGMSADHLDLLGTDFDVRNNAGPAEYAARTDFIFERGGKRGRRMAVARAERSIAELNVLNVVRGVMFNLQSAFVDVLNAKEILSLARQNLTTFNSIVNVNAARVNSGDLAKVELVRSRVAALQFQTAVQQAELRLRQAKNRLQLLMGRASPSENFDVTGALRRDTVVPEFSSLKNLAFDLRPDIRGLVQTQARSQADIRLQLAQGKVDYTVGTEYRRQQGLNGTGNTLGFFVSAPIPIFNRNQGEIARAELEAKQTEARIRALRASIDTEVTNAYQQYLTARTMLENIETNLISQARDVRETTEYSYRRGEASFVELLDAQRAFNDAMQSYNDARAEYARSLYLIDSVSGKTVNP